MTSKTLLSIDDMLEGDDEDEGMETLSPLNNPIRRTSRRMVNVDVVKEEIVYDYDIKNFVHEKPMREWRFTIPCFREPVILNPLTSLIGMVPLWVTTVWCMFQPDKALDTLLNLRGNIAMSFTWFIIITKPLSLFFMLWIAYKYGHIRFGGKDAKPEFGNFEYFAMIFSSGIGVGIFYYGVSEPLWHQSSHWFAEAGYRSQDEIDQWALLITMYHWGFHGFGTYLVVAVATSLASYRFRLPLIFRSSFYPLLGEYTWGYLGDCIDGFSIIVIIGGVCTSLGLGAIQLTAGVQKIGWLDEDLSESDTTRAQIVIIWLVTILTTASVLMGLTMGIRYLSLVAFGLGLLLTLAVFMMEQTSYMMNLIVQTVGVYFQWAIFQLSFHTDAFGQLRPGEGRAVDGNSAAAWWFDAWTIFYWNWWVAWAVFVGLFITRVSYGRTLREVTLYSLVAPVFYLFTWFCIWGGAGLRQARQALELEQLGGTYYNDTEYFQSPDNSACYDVPQQDVVVGDETIFTNYAPGITPVCKFETTNTATFNVLYSFSFPDEWDTGYGPYLSIIFLLALATYFATSSDSGSLVVDFLAANGRHNTHWTQRLFWALTEAAVATALLSAGGSNALSAVQAASIICGLPYTVVLTYLLQSIYEMCEQALDEDRINFQLPRRQFIMPSYGGVFNVFEYIASFGRVHTARVVLGMDLPSSFQVTEFFTSIFLPFLPLQDVVFTMHYKEDSRWTNSLFLLAYAIFFFCWVIAFPMSFVVYPSMAYWGWGAYTAQAAMLARLKHSLRLRRRLHGNIFGDLLSSFLLYPQVITQMRIELMEYGAEQVPDDNKNAKKKNKKSKMSRKKSFDDDSMALGGSSHHSVSVSKRSGQSRRRAPKEKDSDTVSLGSTSTRDRRKRRELGASISDGLSNSFAVDEGARQLSNRLLASAATPAAGVHGGGSIPTSPMPDRSKLRRGDIMEEDASAKVKKKSSRRKDAAMQDISGYHDVPPPSTRRGPAATMAALQAFQTLSGRGFDALPSPPSPEKGATRLARRSASDVRSGLHKSQDGKRKPPQEAAQRQGGVEEKPAKKEVEA